MKAILIFLTVLSFTAKAEAPTDARLFCGSLTGIGSIHIPRGDGTFSAYKIDCRGLSA